MNAQISMPSSDEINHYFPPSFNYAARSLTEADIGKRVVNLNPHINGVMSIARQKLGFMVESFKVLRFENIEKPLETPENISGISEIAKRVFVESCCRGPGELLLSNGPTWMDAKEFQQRMANGEYIAKS